MRTNTPKWGTLVLACLAMLVLAIDLTVLHLAVPALIADLGPSATQVLWIADVYGFALAGLLVTMGNVGDRWGRKRLLLVGAAAFGVASVATAYAPTPELLIAARALLGVAGATIMPSTLSIIRNVFTDPRERTAAVGLWSGVGAAGFAVGPVVAGVLLDHFWWGSVFLVNVPVVAVVVGLGAVVLPESRNPRPGRVDPLSVVLSVVGVVAVVYAIKEAAHSGAGRVDVLAAAVVGVVVLVVFARRQTGLDEPLIDVRLFKARAFSASVGATLVAMFASLSLSLILAQYLQQVLGWTPLQAGLGSLPGGVFGAVGGVLAGALVQRWGRAAVVACGLGLTAAGFALFAATLAVDASFWSMLPAMVVYGTGVGFAFAVTNDTVLASVPRERAGAAASISETATEIGGALGIAVLGSVLGAVYRGDVVLPAGVDAAAGDSLGATLHAAASLPAEVAGPLVVAARQAYVDGAVTGLWVCAGLLVVLAAFAGRALRSVPKVIDDTAFDTADTGPARS
ncbi:DHA2 family efflux MFS transporter permease subunit [Actinosynnema sp. CS-041913]|uniref:DHA2 family efflux MFS transporter permease subunit n=1 Tax=Actinosynnema sp. CS-041913 TaxID=3239917 RepID=UPI003D8B0200